MAQQDEVLALAVESARRVLSRHDEPSWLQLFVRLAYAYEEMTASVQPAHSRAFFAQSNPEVVVRLLSAWLEGDPALDSPGLADALDELREKLGGGAPAPAAAPAPAPAPRRAPVPDVAVMLSGALTSGELSERMQVTRQAINQRRSRGQLLAFKRGREFLYPAWQLGADGAPLGGLGAVLEALGPGSPEAHARFLLSPCEALGGARPIDQLEAGQAQAVIEAAAHA